MKAQYLPSLPAHKGGSSYDIEEIEMMTQKHNSSGSLSNKVRPVGIPRFAVSELIMDFKIDGMTCVSCSRTIENAIQNEYGSKGLISCQIALLTHKMRIVFDNNIFSQHQLTPDIIKEEVEMIGFTAELIEMIENNQDDLLRMHSNHSNDSDEEINTYRAANQQANIIKQCSLIVEGMTCATCQGTIESHLKTLNGIQGASVSLLTHKASIQYKPKIIGIRTIIEEIEALGFSAKYEAQSDKSDIRVIINQSVRKYRKKFFISLALIIPILVLIYIIPYAAPHFVVALTQLNGVPLYIYLNAIFATIIQIFMGAPFYVNSYKALKHKSANMDVLIMLGTSAAWAYGIARIGVGYTEHDIMMEDMFSMQVKEHSHNFEISSALITIILLGKYIETISKKKTVDKLSQLASLKVTKANLIDNNNNEMLNLNVQDKEIEVELVQVNDLVKIYPGSGVPVDGIVVFGKGICNEAMLTGESAPVGKDIGSSVYGGSILLQGNLIVKVTKSAENSSINQIIKMVENAQNAKAPIQGLADRISKYFVPIVILLTFIAWIIWFSYAYSPAGEKIELIGESRFQFAFSFGISTLVIACPCALGLATPTAVMVGTGIAANYGILIKGGDILEKISSITTIVFDKTGTLTSGQPHVKDLISLKEHFRYEKGIDDKDLLMYFAYLTEKASEHPLAKAIAKKIHSLIPSKIEEYNAKYFMKEFKNRDGEGVVAQIISKEDENEQYQVLCGNDKLLKSLNVELNDDELKKNIELLEQEGLTVVTFVVNSLPSLIITMEEAHIAKHESREVVNYLKNKMGLKIAMITGDNQHAAYKVARHLGIDLQNVVFKAYPEDKKKTVERFQANKEKVMFVGDGINDSPVLAQAEVGVAINSGSDITVDAADIVLIKDNLYDVVNAIRISRMSFRRIKINFVWAFLYNILLIPIAMGIFYPANQFKLDPMLAGGAMALSSISVVLSSLMLKLFKPTLSLEHYSQRSSGEGEKSGHHRATNSLNASGTTAFSDNPPHRDESL